MPILRNRKGNNYNPIFDIINWLTMIVNYKLVKIIIDASNIAKDFFHILVRHHSFLNSIVISQKLLLMSKF